MVVYEVSLEKLIMWKLMRIAVLLAALFVGVFPGDEYRHQPSAEAEFPFLIVVFLLFAFVAGFAGSMSVMLTGKSGFAAKPKLAAQFFVRRSPLQFIWFAGLVATSVGVGFMIRGIWDEFSADGFVFLSLGLGLLTGCRVVMAVLRRRFAEV